MFKKMKFATAACAACLVLFTSMFFASNRPPKALAATIEALKNVTSMMYTLETEIEHDGKLEVIKTTSYWSGERTRIDYGGEGQVVHQTLWIEPGKTTTIDYADPAEPLATVVLNAGDNPYNLGRITSAKSFIELMRAGGSVEVVDEHVAGSQKFSVLRFEQWDGLRQNVELTVDLATNLPVSATHTFKGGIARLNFQWNLEINPDLMTVHLPDGVTAKVIDGNIQAPPLPIIPGVGIGSVRLGMTREEVRQVVGRPDKVRLGSDGYPSLMLYTESLGVTVLFGSDENERNRVVSVSGSLGQFVSKRYRDFTGTTPEGIGLGATADEIIAAYGETDNRTISNSGEEIIVYEQPSLDFRLRADPKYGWADDARRTHTILITKYPTPKWASFRNADPPQTVEQRKASGAIRAECASNLKKLGLACIRYASQHDGTFPGTLRDLYPNYVDDLGVFSCPGSGWRISNSQLIDEESSYVINPDMKTSNPSERVLLFEKANHSPGPSGRHECSVGGKVLFSRN